MACQLGKFFRGDEDAKKPGPQQIENKRAAWPGSPKQLSLGEAQMQAELQRDSSEGLSYLVIPEAGTESTSASTYAPSGCQSRDTDFTLSASPSSLSSPSRRFRPGLFNHFAMFRDNVAGGGLSGRGVDDGCASAPPIPAVAGQLAPQICADVPGAGCASAPLRMMSTIRETQSHAFPPPPQNPPPPSCTNAADMAPQAFAATANGVPAQGVRSEMNTHQQMLSNVQGLAAMHMAASAAAGPPQGAVSGTHSQSLPERMPRQPAPQAAFSCQTWPVTPLSHHVPPPGLEHPSASGSTEQSHGVQRQSRQPGLEHQAAAAAAAAAQQQAAQSAQVAHAHAVQAAAHARQAGYERPPTMSPVEERPQESADLQEQLRLREIRRKYTDSKQLHEAGECKPCAWFWKPQGCYRGLACQHCHLCLAGELKERKKKKLQIMRNMATAPTDYVRQWSGGSDNPFQAPGEESEELASFGARGVSMSNAAPNEDEACHAEPVVVAVGPPTATLPPPPPSHPPPPLSPSGLVSTSRLDMAQQPPRDSAREQQQQQPPQQQSNGQSTQPKSCFPSTQQGQTPADNAGVLPGSGGVEEPAGNSNEVGSEEPPSVGSALHASGECKPCAWFHKPQGCLRGKECGYCHYCPPGELKNQRKKKVAAMRETAAQAQAAAAAAAATAVTPGDREAPLENSTEVAGHGTIDQATVVAQMAAQMAGQPQDLHSQQDARLYRRANDPATRAGALPPGALAVGDSCDFQPAISL